MKYLSLVKNPKALHKVHREAIGIVNGYFINNPPFTYAFTFDVPVSQEIDQILICDGQPVQIGVQVGHVIWSTPTFYFPTATNDPTLQGLTFYSTLTWQPGAPASPCTIPASFDEQLIAKKPSVKALLSGGSLIVTVTGGGTSQYGNVVAAYSLDPVVEVKPIVL